MSRRWQLICLASAGVFVALALAASVGGVFPAERGLYQWITGEASPGVVTIFAWVNYLGDKRVLLPATALLILVLPRPLRRRWWLWAGVMVGAPLLEDLAKMTVARPRPEGLAMGFPSGHVSAAAAFFVMAIYLAERSPEHHRHRNVYWACAALLILLVAIARIVLRAHWPLDTVGGVALGLACASAAAWWNERSPASPNHS